MKLLKRTLGRFLSRRWKLVVKRARYLGWARYCPLCRSWLRSFEPFGDPPRRDARCGVCDSLERHRLVWSFFTQRTNLFDGLPKRMLHVAPEEGIEKALRRFRTLDYLTADLCSPSAMVKMDITNIPCADDSFDVIYASHVLEHVLDDRKAMHEIGRVLKRDGWAVFMVPITVEETFEDASVTDPGERTRLFGQSNHVRRYGPDFKNRLEQAGFSVRCYTAAEIVDRKSINRLRPGENTVFLSSKDGLVNVA